MLSGDALLLFELVVMQAIPWAAGIAAVAMLLPLRGPGSLALTLGLGGAAAMPLATGSLRLVDAGSGTLNVGLCAFFLIVLTIVCLVPALLRRRNSAVWANVSHPSELQIAATGGSLARLVTALLAALVIIRLASLLPDLMYRPVFPWDAWKTWVWKARVWFESGSLVAFAQSDQWILATADQYVIEGVNHPDFVSLVALWSALSFDQWDDRWIGIPWLLVGVWSALMMYGLCRFLGLSRLLAWLGTYLLISLPMLASHIALWGYADVWVMLFFQVFTVACLLWAGRPKWEFVLLMALAVLMMALSKDTGLYWLPGLLLAMAAARWSGRVIVLAVVAGGAGLAALWIGYDPLSLLSGGRYSAALQPVGPVLAAIGRQMFFTADWHLLWCLVPVAMLINWRCAATGKLRQRAEMLSAVWLCLAVLGVALLGFLGSRAGAYAVSGTLLGRVLLQITPIFVVLLVLAVHGVAQSAAVGERSRAQP